MKLSPRISVWLACSVLLGGLGWIYAAVGGFDFVLFDDDINLLLNPHIGSLSAEKWAWAWTDMETMRRYLPLGWLGFLGLFHVFGLEPAPYHWVNLGLHALNSVLVFVTVRQAVHALLSTRAGALRSSGASADQSRAEGGRGVMAAFVAAAWWAWHPLRVETVAWVSGVLYLQASAWALLAWWSWLRGCRSNDLSSGFRWRLLSAAALGCSLLCYPIALAFPVVASGWEWLVGRRGALVVARRTALLYLLSAVCLFATLFARSQASGIWKTESSWEKFFLPGRLLAQVYSLFSYMIRPLWPAGLSPVYDTLFAPSLSDPVLWAGAAALLLVLLAGLFLARRWPWLPIVLCCVVLSLVPHLGWFEAVAYPSDRYLYMIGAWSAPVVALLLLSFGRVTGRSSWLFGAAFSVVLLVALGWLARLQADVWRNSETLFARIIEVVNAPELKGFYLARFSTVETMLGRYDESARLAARARAVYPFAPEIKSELARSAPMLLYTEFGMSPLARLHHTLATGHGKAGDARAMEMHLRRALWLSPDAWRVRYDLALLLAYTARPEEARRIFAPIPSTELSAEERARFSAASVRP